MPNFLFYLIGFSFYLTSTHRFGNTASALERRLSRSLATFCARSATPSLFRCGFSVLVVGVTRIGLVFVSTLVPPPRFSSGSQWEVFHAQGP